MCSDVKKKTKHPRGAAAAAARGHRELLHFLHNTEFTDPLRMFAAVLAGKTQLWRRRRTVSLRGGGRKKIPMMRNNLAGGCFSLGQSENRAKCFWLPSEILGNVLFRNLAELLFWTQKCFQTSTRPLKKSKESWDSLTVFSRSFNKR